MRDKSIDVLRFIGLSCIILVHCNSPFLISQLRCFDVPLMLFVSGLACSGKVIPNYREYIIKRAKRLLIPTWCFVSVFLIMILAAQYALHKPLLSYSYIAESYAMTGGIGYVWIVRVFLLVAIITPMIMWIEKRISNDNGLICSVLIGGGIIEMIVFYSSSMAMDSFMQRMTNEWIVTLFAYSLFFLMGLRMRRINAKRAWKIAGFFSLMMIVALAVYYSQHGLPIRLSPNYKYPPHSYYILYGFFACSLLWSARNWFAPILGNKLFLFIGQNTIWIYLYHILFLYIPIPINWVLKYFVVYGGALLMFSLQYALYKRLKGRFSMAKYLIG